ncbi:MAG: glycoside hydrolase family 13 protein [bacterium]|nr:glycoside hydrolase family 13 protein [bacterium]
MQKSLVLPILLVIFFVSCTNKPSSQNSNNEPAISDVPEWAQNAIWYQIFVERFRNGDESNDPTKEDIKGADPEYIPENWSVTRWGQDWYKKEDWQANSKANGFYHVIQQRRYGGDLQGILDKLDYIDSLGINAVYFNPINDSPSLHKYDARNYRHIDRNFGPDPRKDADLIETEEPSNPSTWKWTAADKQFLEVVKAFHARGIKVIMDYSWNHTGTQFWAIKDIKENGEDSKYKDWFNVKSFDNPQTDENEFEYEGWAGYRFMPVVNKDIIPEDDEQMPFEGNIHSESLKNHIFNVSKRWLDPNGDGNPEDGVDGFRLDVAGEVPMGFWRDYRKIVKSINSEAYIVGEIWWLEWPEKFLGPQPFLKGDQFDAIMNYCWYRLSRGFFAQAEPLKTPSEFVAGIQNINKNISEPTLRAMMNMSASHDSPRLSTSLYNKTMYKYEAKPSDNPDYKIEKPDNLTLQEQKLFLISQFTFQGSPQIWNGDEIGMWGADDPDCRKPMVWDDIQYDDENTHFVEGKWRRVDKVEQDKELLEFYKKIIGIRKDNSVLSMGDLRFNIVDDEKMLLGYVRSNGSEEIQVIFNRSSLSQEVQIPKTANYLDLIENKPVSEDVSSVILKPISAIILKKQQ